MQGLSSIFMFSCPEQLNRTHCLSVCLSVRPQQLTVSPLTTLQSDPRDLRPLRLLFKVLRTPDLLPSFTTILDGFDKFLTNWTILTNSDNSDHFTFFYNFDNWQQFSQFIQLLLPFCQMKKQTWKFATFEPDNRESEFTATFVIWQLIVTMDGIRNSCDVWQNNSCSLPGLINICRLNCCGKKRNFGLHQNRLMAPSESCTANPFAQKYHLLHTKFVFIIENQLVPKVNSYSPRLLYFNCFTDPNCIASHLGPCCLFLQCSTMF